MKKQIALVMNSTPSTGGSEQVREIIDETELLKRLPIFRRSLVTWRQKGIIPSIKIFRRRVYDWKSVHDALLRLKQRGGPR